LDLQEYTALNVVVSRLVFEKVAKVLKQPQSNVAYEGPKGVDKNNKVKLFLGRRLVADCLISYVGCAGDNITEKWGEMKVQPEKAKVNSISSSSSLICG